MNQIIDRDNKKELMQQSNLHWKFQDQLDLQHPKKRLETGVEKQRKKVTTTHM